MPGLISWCYHLLSWTDDLTSLSIFSLLCNMKEVLVPTSHGCCEDEMK